MKEKGHLIIGGAVVGVVSVALTLLGNPANMGFCIACFLRDTAGAIKLHSASAVQYLRPEIIGLILGAAVLSIARREFRPRGGSAPFTRFVLGFWVMIGALVFLGCPLRMVLRIAAGDLNAVLGLIGFICGIGLGVLFLQKGFSLGRTYNQPKLEGAMLPAVQLVLLFVLLAAPMALAFSDSGPASMRAPVLASLAAGLIAGAIAQRTRLCMAGGIRDAMLFRDWTLLSGFVGILVAAFVMNLAFGKFNPGFAGQPIAHTEGLWNFLGMALVGFGSVLLGGCPLRQLIMAGEGNGDSAVTVLGFVGGAAISHNFGLASSPEGATPGGKAAVIAGILVCALIAVYYTFFKGGVRGDGRRQGAVVSVTGASAAQGSGK
jgi:YedE family putative selenium metabolism protein